MNKYDLITILALLVILIALPFYGLSEAARLASAQTERQAQLVSEGALLYLENCADCHDIDGSGLGVMPALNRPEMAEVDGEFLYQAIARAAHGSKMVAWHVEEGGSLSEYQIESLITFVQHASWSDVAATAVARSYIPPEPATIELVEVVQDDPHRCAACHEQPDIHINQFGLDCTRCHSLEAWTPALLTRHTFALDHGSEGQVTCETCHVETYAENNCYACHDHQPDEMLTVHEAEAIFELDDCVACHSTGAPGEALPGVQTLSSAATFPPVVSSHR